MGSFSKALGQLFRASLETESASIHKHCAANKVAGSLSLALDSTLKEGHDMKIFGVGTAASMADRPRYARFTAAMFHVYASMEKELDACLDVRSTGASAKVWEEHSRVLRRAKRLEQDLKDVVSSDGVTSILGMTPAVTRYVETIQNAGCLDRDDGGARLLGHLYCRYFADLFGGQMLSWPYQVALGLDEGTPRHYTFIFPEDVPQRKDYIEKLYQSINSAGVVLDATAREEAISQAREAFKHNIDVYSEEPNLYGDGVRGIGKVAMGALMAAPNALMSGHAHVKKPKC